MNTTASSTVQLNENCCSHCISTCIAVAAVLIFVLFLLKKYLTGGIYTQKPLDLTKKYAVVTGGNSGIGAETVKYLASLGCSIIIGARDRKTAESVIKDCRQANPSSKVEFIQLDLASRESIKEFAEAVQFPQIDFLINNAGVMAIPSRRLTKEGVEMQWGVNHLGHFYLTHLLWSKIQASTSFRIVNVSSLAHKEYIPVLTKTSLDFDNINFDKAYDTGLCYGRSKLYNVLFTHALAQKINPSQGKVLSLHPGVVRTELLREIKSEGAGKYLDLIMIPFHPIYWFFTKTAWQGCQTTLHATLSEEVENGCYYADCQKASENPLVTKENWNTLWAISERTLGLTFKV